MIIWEYLLKTVMQALRFLAIGLLPYLIFALLMQKISNAIRIRLASLLSLKGYIYLTAPGVMIHELSHAFFCLLFRHKIAEMKLFAPTDDGTLGYVSHTYNPKSRFQRIGNFFIGTGPVWGGVFALWIVTLIFLPSEVLDFKQGCLEAFFKLAGYMVSADFWCNWRSYCWLYLILTISSHVTLSAPDLAGAAGGAIALVGFVFLFELIFGWCEVLNSRIDNVLHTVFVSTSSILGLFVLITLLIAIVLMIFVRKRCH